jgi:hypothetical protein
MCVRCPPNTLRKFSKWLYGTKDVILIRGGAFKRLNMETIPITSSCKTCMCRIMRGVVEIHINICNILYNGACLMSFGLKGSNGKMMTMSWPVLGGSRSYIILWKPNWFFNIYIGLMKNDQVLKIFIFSKFIWFSNRAVLAYNGRLSYPVLTTRSIFANWYLN